MRPVSMTELVILCSLDHTTIAARVADAGIVPIGTKGKATLYPSNLALRAILAPGNERRSALTPSERLSETRNSIAELELAERRRELLPRADVINAWQKLLTAIRAKLLALPTKLAAMIAPPGKLAETEQAISAAIDEVLTELADGSGIDFG